MCVGRGCLLGFFVAGWFFLFLWCRLFVCLVFFLFWDLNFCTGMCFVFTFYVWCLVRELVADLFLLNQR